MRRHAILLTFLGLLVAGCASDKKVETMESSGGTAPTASSQATTSSPALSSTAGESPSTSPTVSAAATTESNSTNQSGSSRDRIGAGVEEETLDTCLAHIPKNATAGQRMMAEQTCRRDFARR
jgi:activator of HSP90 ATPase